VNVCISRVGLLLHLSPLSAPSKQEFGDRHYRRHQFLPLVSLFTPSRYHRPCNLQLSPSLTIRSRSNAAGVMSSYSLTVFAQTLGFKMHHTHTHPKVFWSCLKVLSIYMFNYISLTLSFGNKQGRVTVLKRKNAISDSLR